MAGVPYSEWISYVERILLRMGRQLRVQAGAELHVHTIHRVLDLCCGTGTVSALLADLGCDVVGVDISSEMIEIARRKARDKGRNIEYRVGDASSFTVPGKFDLAVSFFDSLNYITEADQLQQAFYRVSEHLEPGGLFIFDMNTEFALAAGFFDQRSLVSNRPVTYDWKSVYDPATRICRVSMSFRYRRGGEVSLIDLTHFQRAYDIGEVSGMLRSAGFEVHAVYAGYSFRPATSTSDRVFFVAGKV
ncbi:MAG: methyltransferase domain-containing protein [Armatimonadetes bacterium]|nr:methyltransferase domain-containing protein [Armatimonadota bacterium]